MPATTNQKRIFVVDDERIIATTLTMIFSQSGFDASSYTDSVKALEDIQFKAPDLLICDVVMPTLSGIELAIKMRETCPQCKVLLFSGQASTDHMLESARSNGHQFEVISKPIHPQELLRRVELELGLAR